MYTKFILKLNDLEKLKNENDRWHDYIEIGREELKKTENSIKNNLDEFIDPDGSLQANKIINHWFPSINADIFISHSHKDYDLVLGLSGWLKEEFGLTVFIDSVVWGHSDNLLKNIDNKYCRISHDDNRYNYLTRNRSTTHVHMMLSTALMHMIDKCEMFLFIETQNSFIPSKYLKSEGETESPWIYSELSLVDKIRIKQPERIQNTIYDSLSLETLKIKYPTNINNFNTLTHYDLIEWKNRIKSDEKTKENLDKLYNIIFKQ